MKRLKSIGVVLSVLIISMGAINSCGGGGGNDTVSKATVSGVVLDSNGNPVFGALVTITSTPVTTNTDATGYFSAEIEIGDHTLTISVGSYTVCQHNFKVDDESPVDLGDLDPTAPYYSGGETWFKDIDRDLYSDGTNVDSETPLDGFDLAANLTSTSGDCNDNDGSINPGATDVCNSVDDNCDGSIDEDFVTLGDPCSAGQGECAAFGNYICAGDGSDVICDATPGSPVAEVCDGLDNNCDGVVDDGNPGGGVSCDTSVPGVCAAGTTLCASGSLVCEQNVPAIAEICDGLDNDCDGVADEGNPQGGGACSTGEPGVCSAGTQVCLGGSLDCVRDILPSSELCDDLDNDCDGEADEDFVTLGDPCSAGQGECAAFGNYICAGDGSDVTCDATPGSPVAEVCDGLDNDCDGDVDEEVCNLPPVANNMPAVLTSEDITVQVILSATDPDGDSLIDWSYTNPVHGSLSGTAPNLFYSPDADYFGLDSFTFSVSDGAARSNTATVSVTIDPTSDIFYVDIDAVGTEDGHSWTNAFIHPQDGMDVASPGDQVWVADGTYTSLFPADPTVPVLYMFDGVEVYGGFAGTETSLFQRNPLIHVTLLDGMDITQTVVVGADDILISGFTITGGNGLSPADSSAVAIAAKYLSNVRVQDCVISGNTSSYDPNRGAVGINISDGEVTNCIFTNNSGRNAPLVIPWYSTGDVFVNNCLLYENATSYGGGILSSGNGNVYINNTTVVDNTAGTGSGIYVEQGAVSQTGNTYITNSIVWNNGIYAWKAPTITYSDVQGGYTGTGNINSDPLFNDAANDNYRLSSASPCIDSGDNTAVTTSYDLDENPRIVDGPDVDSTATVDMGVYEYKIPIWYVDIASTAVSPDGTSWPDAFTHPQSASDAAASGDQVWVAAGVYTSLDTVTPLPVLTMKDGVEFYGGFEGTESLLSERDPDTYAATLDGENLVNHVVVGASNARLDGFNVVRGYASHVNGGGMSNVEVDDLTIANCLFADNTVSDCATPSGTSYECGKGAGVFNDGSTVTIEDSYFFNNSNTSGFGIGEGGGLANYGVSNIQVISSVFDSNSAGGGAGVQNAELTTTWLENCLFINNSAINGAALNNYDLTGISPNNVTVTNCTFTNNAASSSGGGIYNHASSPVVKNSILYGNTPNQITNIISGSAVVSYSDVQGGYAGTNIDVDPVFLNAGNENYRLGNTSPCIDSGDNAAVTTSYDLDGNSRIVDGPDGDLTATVDMGAYEYVGP